MMTGPKDDGSDRVIMSGGSVSLHDAFQRDVMRLLENTGISDEDRLRILSNTTCPCCGSSASMVVPLEKVPPKKA
jgi:hypothetical protein